MKILIVKTSSMGDVVHALPVLSDIKKAFPDSQIDWLVEEPFADIVRATSLVDNVYLSNVRKWRKTLFGRKTLYEVVTLRDQLRDAKYDLVIDLQGLYKSAVLCKLTSAPVAGYDSQSAREGGASIFYNKKFNVSRKKSAVTRCRELASQALGYPLSDSPAEFIFDNIQRFSSSEEKSHETKEPKDKHEAKDKQAIFFANASRKTKLWPADNWVELGKRLAEQGFRILLPWGSAEDYQRVRWIAQGIGDSAKVLDHLSIGQLMALIGSSTLVVGLDTGMTHLSSAIGTPTVGLFLDYPIELVPLVGNGKKKALGGVDFCPTSEEVLKAISETIR